MSFLGQKLTLQRYHMDENLASLFICHLVFLAFNHHSRESVSHLGR